MPSQKSSSAKAEKPAQSELRYQSGFGNEFASEAVEVCCRAGRILRKKLRTGCMRSS